MKILPILGSIAPLMRCVRYRHSVVQSKNASLEVYAITDRNKQMTSVSTISNVYLVVVQTIYAVTSCYVCQHVPLTQTVNQSVVHLDIVPPLIFAWVERQMTTIVTLLKNVLAIIVRTISAHLRIRF